ncbi:MAG: hypothetical protein JJU48_10655 [Methylophaga sp.]|nr:hypothetical protein [Methylophaga sp.]
MSNTPHYQAIKVNGLDEGDRQRLRVAISTQLRISGILKENSRHLLANKLTAFLESPQKQPSNELFNWLLTYGTPALIAHLLKQTAGFSGSHQARLDLIRRGGIERLLLREHISPDLQLWQSCEHPQTALICFTGKGGKLNIPVQLFHSCVASKFDLIIYLRDPHKRLFTRGIPGIATTIESLGKYLHSQIPEGCNISIIGTSGGGYAAMAIAEQLNAHRIALFSPPLTYEGKTVTDTEKKLPARNVRLYFARYHELDIQWANNWKKTSYRRAIRWLKTDSHGTLSQLFRTADFEPLLGWLRADQPEAGMLHYLRKLLPY